MPDSYFPQKAAKLEIQAYKQSQDIGQLRKSHVPFSGLLKKHPHDDAKVVLVTDPDSTSTSYYEFKTGDIGYAQELPTLVNLEGETMTMIRIWVKKKSLGIRFIPFLVEDTRI